MSDTADAPLVLGRGDVVFIRDVLALTDRYLRNPFRSPLLAGGIALAAADGAARLTRRLDTEEDH